jgi:hypothetical protein
MLEPPKWQIEYCLTPKNSERDSVKSAIVIQCLLMNELIDGPCQSKCNLPEMSLDPQTEHAVNRVKLGGMRVSPFSWIS